MITTEYIVGAAGNHTAAHNPHIPIAIVDPACEKIPQFPQQDTLYILTENMMKPHTFRPNLDFFTDSCYNTFRAQI